MPESNIWSHRDLTSSGDMNSHGGASPKTASWRYVIGVGRRDVSGPYGWKMSEIALKTPPNFNAALPRKKLAGVERPGTPPPDVTRLMPDNLPNVISGTFVPVTFSTRLARPGTTMMSSPSEAFAMTPTLRRIPLAATYFV